MKEYTAQVFSEEKFSLGESPFYDSRTKAISWVDIPKGIIYTETIDGKKDSFCLGQAIGSAIPAEKEGSYILAATDGLYLLEKGNATLIKSLKEFYKAYQRSNDAKADSLGRLWFGSSVDDDIHEASGNLFLLDGKNVICKEANTKISNGMAWRSDNKKFYFSDTLQHAVFSYDFDLASAEISNKKVLFTPTDGNGLTDGMCIDREDNLWVAMWGGSRIEKRSGKDGSLLATVHVDAKNVTSCCFIGEELDTLFITTSGKGLTGEHDGCLFTCKVDALGKECDYVKL
ncbi:MAG: SMP-30/gluconolactonase/LRE family protein [Treponema sp.]|nr:SMP-30/gluconolactonase/LRE family protein [Treponema sp.]